MCISRESALVIFIHGGSTESKAIDSQVVCSGPTQRHVAIVWVSTGRIVNLGVSTGRVAIVGFSTSHMVNVEVSTGHIVKEGVRTGHVAIVGSAKVI